ncbi:hypothetical protein FRC19_006528 [Serendipita sp. 401]|nr:hypothetical protein FRC19_006528 [Serendipita sp. 401]KAG9058093.1 hypothetical protein FS842_001674 [Serendipita sp. 407]
MNPNHDTDHRNIPTIGNERLPFDVLVQVFRYYQLNESPFTPVETLLLVCKAWNKAASDYPPIWSRYNINIDKKIVSELWLLRIPLRLSRSGLKTPLHIDIQIFLSKWYLASTWVISLLEILAGENGALCAKWKSLRFCDYSQVCFSMENGEHALKAFTYPMPLLTSLKIFSVNMSAGVVIFPYLPSLTSVCIYNSEISNYPDMSHATRIELSNVCYRGEIDELIRVPEVQELRLCSNIRSIRHPREYKNLQTLDLQMYRQISDLEEVSMPSLSTLYIEFEGIAAFRPVLKFPAIASIHTLYLKGVLPPEIDRKETYRITSHILRTSVCLRELRVTKYVLSILLEDWHAWEHLFKAESAIRVILMGIWSGETKLILGEGDTNSILEKVASACNLPIPNFSALT